MTDPARPDPAAALSSTSAPASSAARWSRHRCRTPLEPATPGPVRCPAPSGAPSCARGSPSALATGAYGVSVGALSVAAGLSVWQTCVLSLVMFTGGSHFAFVGIIGTGGVAAAPAAIAASSMLGVRNGLYALELRRLLAVRGWRTPAAAHLTIDESTAVAVAQDDRGPRVSGSG